MFDIKYELNQVPMLPGVYLMHNANDEIIYVGKAKLLKNRVRQYFQSNRNMLPRTKIMVSQIVRFEYIVTESEMEALILERNLIKKHMPMYNVMLKDDKNYPLIKITLNEEYPRVFLTRKVIGDGAKYFGPYTSAFAVRDTIELLNNLYPLKKCSKVFPRDIKKTRPCINYQIGRCLAPCQGETNKKEYTDMINDICEFLDGNFEKTIKEYNQKMEEYSINLEFEKAAVIRDSVLAINKLKEKQNVSLTKLENGDFIAIYGDDSKVCVQLFFLRGNNIVGRHSHVVDKPIETSYREIISEFILQYYDKNRIIPKYIYTQIQLENKGELESLLGNYRGTRVYIQSPKKGEKNHIMQMAVNNARIEFKKTIKAMIDKENLLELAVENLAEFLAIGKIERIEAFDISNTGKNDVVASMVVFDKNKFDKKSYRKYNIKGEYGINDYMAMREVLSRRYKYFSKNFEYDKKTVPSNILRKPDLVLVDGGLGHVSSAREAFLEIGVDFNLAGMVKDNKHRTKAIVFEGEVLDLRGEMELLRLITLIQDEVHRFTIEFNRNKRKRRVIFSKLDEIEGVGPKRKKELIKEFGSIKGIRNADVGEIAKVYGISLKLAKKIKEEI